MSVTKVILLIGAGIVAILALFMFRPCPSCEESVANVADISTIEINNTVFQVDIADDVEERTLGLSGRESLLESTGLLFVFESPSVQRFWMKDMNFPIDIIWIDESLRVVDVTRNAQPDSYPQTFSPSGPVQYVLEVNAGEAQNIEIGAVVSFQKK